LEIWGKLIYWRKEITETMDIWSKLEPWRDGANSCPAEKD
jgi:hypothetical protein